MTATEQKYGIVLVTAATEAEAKAIAQALVSEKLAACVSLLPVQSIYIWQSEVNHDQEWQLLIKTNLALFDTLAERVGALHSYKVPEIIAVPILQGSASYLTWIAQQTTAAAHDIPVD